REVARAGEDGRREQPGAGSGREAGDFTRRELRAARPQSAPDEALVLVVGVPHFAASAAANGGGPVGRCGYETLRRAGPRGGRAVACGRPRPVELTVVGILHRWIESGS